MTVFKLIIPALLLFTFLIAVIKKVKIYDVFTEGVKDAFPLILSVFPYIATVLITLSVFEASGLEEKILSFLSPVFSFFGVPNEIAELVFAKPLSGSGSTAVLANLIGKYGADSYLGRCACVVYASSETVFYIGAVYFAKSKEKKITTALRISLFSYFATVILCCFLCRIL